MVAATLDVTRVGYARRRCGRGVTTGVIELDLAWRSALIYISAALNTRSDPEWMLGMVVGVLNSLLTTSVPRTLQPPRGLVGPPVLLRLGEG